MTRPCADRADQGTYRFQSKRRRVRLLCGNVRRPLARATSLRNALSLRLWPGRSCFELSTFPIFFWSWGRFRRRLLRRRQEPRACAHHFAIGPALFAKENFAFAWIAIKPASQ